MTETRYRICSICEATCGLEFTLEGDEIISIKGNKGDVFSHGFICPKGVALRDLHNDPDRLKTPLIKRNGKFVEASWDEAFDEIRRRLPTIMQEYGKESVGTYSGNPGAHKISLGLYGSVLLKALGTPNVFTASTLDQMPKQLSSGLMFGSWLTIAVPDIDHTNFLLVLGGNPLVSNGSIWTVADFRGRLKALQARGGKMVVIDPKRSETAKAADGYHPIKPGTDGLLLAAMAYTLFNEGLVDLGHLAEHLNGFDEIEPALVKFSPETVTELCGIESETIRQLARDLAGADRAAVYGRMGTCTQEFGTLNSWLVDVLNVLSGNLDRSGGVMLPKAAAFARNTEGQSGKGRGIVVGRKHSRVGNHPEVAGEFPAVCLAEEIETPGEGQIRALVSIAGNPVLSAPGGDRLAKALGTLDFMVSLDIYVNETTRFADVILPGVSPLEEEHWDTALNQLATRNTARYSQPLFDKDSEQPHEWEILLKLAAIVTGGNEDVSTMDDAIAASLAPEGALEKLISKSGPTRLVELGIRTGPYGDGFGENPDGLTLEKLIDDPNGVDLGPLTQRIPEVLRTPSGKIELAPEPLMADLERLKNLLETPPKQGLLMIGRRHLRTNNSWMHNLPILAKGPNLCTLQIHPTDAAPLGLKEGTTARIKGPKGSFEMVAEITEDVMQGIVCAPHGWGHDAEDTELSVAAKNPGGNSNAIASEGVRFDPLSGNAVLNGIPVIVEAVR
ncbi:MAG: molybdopterin-dependent oxidoreductase [Rhodospirillales bacterium]|nr:molybdopterin-dependent oxidoreductase [Rhodospirillales bacterium]